MMQGLTFGVVALFVFVGGFLYYIIAMPGQAYNGPLAPLDERGAALRDQLEAHVQTLASEIGERNVWRTGTLDEAATYIEAQFVDAGFVPTIQPFGVSFEKFKNVEVSIPGQTRADEIIVFGAHYDTVRGCPGADDNASGIAALLELARLVRDKRFARTVRFVAFGNEEAPFFATDDMGSLTYAMEARAKGEKILGMISIESVGIYLHRPGTQEYPPPLSWFYPDVGAFISFVGNVGSRDLVRRSIASFRAHAQFPSEGIAAPEGLAPDIIRSDHFAFWHEGYPALMVTDTADFRYSYYHSAMDTPDRLHYDDLTRVVLGLTHVVEGLATPQ